jgi:hypothetical protein
MKNLRHNARGVLRDDSFMIAKISAFPFTTFPNASARALMLVAGAAGCDSNQAVRVCRLCDLTSTPVCNLVVGGSPVHSIVTLLQGTQDTELMPAKEGFETTRVLQSRSVKCLLGEMGSKSFNLMAYCHENQLLVYKLDDETAVVLISAVIVEDDNTWTLVADRMQKIKERDIEATKGALLAEMNMFGGPNTISAEAGTEPSEVVEGLRSLKRARTISKWPSSPAPSA